MEKLVLEEVLAKLYKSELNCEVGSFWDGQWRVRLGDSQNGFVATEDGLHLPEVAPWLIAAVQEHCPASEFAKSYEPVSV